MKTMIAANLQAKKPLCIFPSCFGQTAPKTHKSIDETIIFSYNRLV